ncbi:hypothetical protein C8Q80DRAFT_1265712 [Daedaleopsis nitida]|nr:hypothetical protein C8Q80DRAFT_1265712 [Daedaleopsis nitida]
MSTLDHLPSSLEDLSSYLPNNLITEALSSNTVDESIECEIRRVTSIIENIKEGFRSVKRDLNRLDTQGFFDSKKNPLNMETTWCSYEAEFTEILQTSGRATIKVTNAMQSYTVALRASYNNITLPIQTNIIKATSTSLRALSEKIKVFRNRLDDALGYANTSQVIPGLEKVIEDINYAEVALKEATEQIASLGVEFLKGSQPAGGVGLWQGIINLVPAIGNAIEGVSEHNVTQTKLYREAQGRKTEAEKRKAHCMLELGKFTHQKDLIMHYYATLTDTHGSIVAIADKISAISRIWHGLHVNMLTLQDKIENCTEIGENINQWLMEELRTTVSDYEKIHTFLSKFLVHVVPQ